MLYRRLSEQVIQERRIYGKIEDGTMGEKEKYRCFKGWLPVPEPLVVLFLSSLAQLACKQNFWVFGHFLNVLILPLCQLSHC